MKITGNTIVFVTGAGRGVGRAISVAFAARGARIAAQDISPVNLQETIRLVDSSGSKGVELVGDMSKKMQVQGLIEAARESLGEINILINQGSVAPAVDLLGMDEWDWDRTFGVNLKGYFLASQSIGRLMRERGEGVIVNMIIPPTRFSEAQNHPAYEISAAGVCELTRQAGREFSQHGVQVFAVQASREPSRITDRRPDQDIKSGEMGELELGWWQREPEKVASAVIELVLKSVQIAPGEVFVLDDRGLME